MTFPFPGNFARWNRSIYNQCTMLDRLATIRLSHDTEVEEATSTKELEHFLPSKEGLWADTSQTLLSYGNANRTNHSD